MKFETRSFSHRTAPLNCAVFLIHEPYQQPQVGKTFHRATAAAIILPSGHYWVGVTVCSDKDQFVKSVGRAKATGRAYQEFKARGFVGARQMMLTEKDFGLSVTKLLRAEIDVFKAQRHLQMPVFAETVA